MPEMSAATETLHRNLIRHAMGMVRAWQAWVDAKSGKARPAPVVELPGNAPARIDGNKETRN